MSLHQFSAESLAGRIEILYLREFSLRELASLKYNIEIPKTSILANAINAPDEIQHELKLLSPFKAILEETLKHYLIWGGLPEICLAENEDSSLIYLGNYLQTYLEKDVRAIHEITNLNAYQQLMEIIAAQTGSIREDKKILDSLGASRETLKKYRGYLSATLVYQEISPFIRSALKRLTKSPKGYLLNNGLISFLTGVRDYMVLNKTGLLGHRFENWFLQSLNICLDQFVDQHKIYYWRTSSGVEVDFVIDKKPFVYPFEITSGTSKDSKKIKHLKQFLAEEKGAVAGFYIYNGSYEYDPDSNIHFIPAWSIN